MQMADLVVCWQQLELFGVVLPLPWYVWESGEVLATGLVISPQEQICFSFLHFSGRFNVFTYNLATQNFFVVC
jgi:hypothetical protein